MKISLRFAPIALLLALSTPAFSQTPAPSASASPIASPTAKPTPVPRTPADAVTPVFKNSGLHAVFMDRKTAGEIGVLFLGDSITDFWPRRGEWSWMKLAPFKPADFGISGERTEGVLGRITEGQELDGISPKVTVIMIGTNNIGHFPNEESAWAAAGVQKIVETVHEKIPGTKVILFSVFPRAGSLDTKVKEINQIIAKLHDGKTTYFVDMDKVLRGPDGLLLPGIMPDGLHPNSKGYDLWYDALIPVLTDLYK